MQCLCVNPLKNEIKNDLTCIGMSAHEPHKQLKTIRKRVGITQKTAADMLGVSYPYLLSIETGFILRGQTRPMESE